MTMHKLRSVRPVRSTPYGLKLVWQDGREDVVEMAGVIYRYKVFAALRDNRKLFRGVKTVDRGLGIEWTDAMDYSAQSLRRLADEQRPMSGQELRAFELENGLTAADTAAVLDVGVRTVKAYRHARKLPVPVAIAIRAMRAEPGLLAAHYRPISPRMHGSPKGRDVIVSRRIATKRASPRVSKATGGPMPGFEIDPFQAVQEIEDIEYVERMKRFK